MALIEEIQEARDNGDGDMLSSEDIHDEVANIALRKECLRVIEQRYDSALEVRMNRSNIEKFVKYKYRYAEDAYPDAEESLQTLQNIAADVGNPVMAQYFEIRQGFVKEYRDTADTPSESDGRTQAEEVAEPMMER